MYTIVYTYLISSFICKHHMLVDLPASSPPCSCSGFSSGSPLPGVVPEANCSALTIEVNPVLTSANPWRTSLSHLPPADGQSISESKYGDLQKGQSDNGSLQFTPVHPLEKEAQHAQTASKLQRASPQPITL